MRSAACKAIAAVALPAALFAFIFFLSSKEYYLLIPAVPLAVCYLMLQFRYPIINVLMFLFIGTVSGEMIQSYHLLVGGIRVYLSDIMVALLLADAAILLLARKKLSLPRLTLYGLFLVTGLIALALGFARGWEARDILGDFRRIYIYSVCFPLVYMFTKKSHMALLQTTVYLSSVCLFLVTAYRVLAGRFLPQFGGIIHPTDWLQAVFSGLALFFVAASLAVYGRLRWWHYIIGTLSLFNILLANYRTPWIAYFIAMLVLLLLTGPKGRRLLSKGMVLLLLGLLLSLALIHALKLHDISIIQGILKKADKLVHFQKDQSARWRIYAWSNAVKLFAEHPVFGQGLGKRNEFNMPSTQNIPYRVLGHRTHNSYLWLLYVSGITGLTTFLLLIVPPAFRMLRRIGAYPSPSQNYYVLALSGMFLVLILSPLFGVGFETVYYALIFYFFLGMTAKFLSCGFAEAPDANPHT